MADAAERAEDRLGHGGELAISNVKGLVDGAIGRFGAFCTEAMLRGVSPGPERCR